MFLSDCIADYLRYALHERGLAKKTFKSYQARLHNLHGWLQQNGYPTPTLADFTLPVLRRYYYHEAGRGLRPRTLLGVVHPIRGLGAYLVTVGALTENPARLLTLPKKDAAQRKTVSDEEITLLLDACERQRTPRQVALARGLLSVFVYCGLRRQECLDLHISDVNLSSRSLLVRNGKGGKSRQVFLCEPAVNALSEWLALRPADTLHDWLWAYDRSRRLHDNGLRAIMETLKANAGLRDNDGVCPHSLRHACATRLLRGGANIRDIQVWLGHSQITTTVQYLHTSEEQLRKIAALTQIPAAPGKPDTKRPIDRLARRRLPLR